MSQIDRVVQMEEFLERAKEEISGAVCEMTGSVFHPADGVHAATVSEFDCDDSLTFEVGKGDEQDWPVKFAGTGMATLSYLAAGGRHFTAHLTGKITGT